MADKGKIQYSDSIKLCCLVNPVKRIILESKLEMYKWFIFRMLFPTHICSVDSNMKNNILYYAINCNFIFSIILENLDSFKSSNLLSANKLTNTLNYPKGD